jgi:3-oxoacyl-[acyl-carrier-protein] synthase II
MIEPSKKRRVVVTGLGVISSIGIGWQEFWKNLIAGKSGISRIEGSENYDLESKFAGPVRDFDAEKFFNNQRMSHLGRTTQMALAATRLALQDARLKYEDLKDYKVGVSIGTTMGEPQLLEVMDNIMVVKGAGQIAPHMLPITA